MEKLWSKIGAESDAFFYASKHQPNTLLPASTPRYGLRTSRTDDASRGVLGKQRVLSNAWVHDSTTPDAAYLKQGGPEGGYGYAYQWSIPQGDDGVFMGPGIYGQCIYVNPARHVVIVQTSAWPEPVSHRREEERGAVFDKIASEIVP